MTTIITKTMFKNLRSAHLWTPLATKVWSCSLSSDDNGVLKQIVNNLIPCEGIRTRQRKKKMDPGDNRGRWFVFGVECVGRPRVRHCSFRFEEWEKAKSSPILAPKKGYVWAGFVAGNWCLLGRPGRAHPFSCRELCFGDLTGVGN